MGISPGLRDVILRKQSGEECHEYESRLTACFAEVGQGHLDVQIESLQSNVSKESFETEFIDAGLWTSQEEEVLKTKNGRCLQRWQVRTMQELRPILKITPRPRRIFFMRQRNSRSRLSVSRELFDYVCEQCGVFEKFREIVLCFGLRKSELYTSQPRMRFQFLTEYECLEPAPEESSFECSYLMRFVEATDRIEGFKWSLRQSGVYHKHVTNTNENNIIFVALSSTLESYLNTYLTQLYNDAESNAFELHYMLFQAATSGWKGCIAYLAEEVQRQSDIVFMTEFEGNDFHVTSLEERQYLKKIEDFTIDLSTALNFMTDNLSSIIEHYRAFQKRSRSSLLPKSSDPSMEQNHSDVLMFGFESQRKDLAMFHVQLESLQRKVRSVSNLVSNILDLNNGDALKLLAVETKLENARMAVLTQKSVQDAASVKVLTIITLVYLPLTVVTNFFSTSFIGSKTNGSDSQRISVTTDVWILFVIGIPLTIITVWLWWLFAQREMKGEFPGRVEHVVRYVTGRLSRRKKSLKPLTEATEDGIQI